MNMNGQSPYGMAWIDGRQKPFWHPRKIRRGRHRGMIEVVYLKKPGIYRKIRIPAAHITFSEHDSRHLAHQTCFDDLKNS
ncbi:MAG: hypothetical protein SWH61_04820 [Thermodesulfobacteriota bacterium]|nr:hypothetical protein [Thermodesulfobacteriota bacterium]